MWSWQHIYVVVNRHIYTLCLEVYMYMVIYVSIFPLLPAEISKNTISIIFYLKESF